LDYELAAVSTGFFCVKTFSGSPCIMRTCIVQVDIWTLIDFLRECKVIPSNKHATTVSQKNAALYVLSVGISTRLCIPLTDQRKEIEHFSVSIFDWLFLTLHFVTTLISNIESGDSTERTMIHLQWWHCGNQ
jgi:hypothetical protein